MLNVTLRGFMKPFRLSNRVKNYQLTLYALLSNDGNDEVFHSMLTKKTANPFEDPSRKRKKIQLHLNESLIDRSSNMLIASVEDAKRDAVINRITAASEPSRFQKDFENIDAELSHLTQKFSSATNESIKPARALSNLWEQVLKKIGLDIETNASEEEKNQQRRNRNTKIGVMFGAGTIMSVFAWFCLHYGKTPRDSEGKTLQDEFSGSLLAPFYRIRKSIHMWMDYVIEPSREVLLPPPLTPPYYQPKYTLVMELKHFLVAPDWSYSSGYRFKKRPALDYFLNMVKYPNFEVVLYTSESSFNAHELVETIDPGQRIMYKLYRDCTKYMNGHHVKVLSKLNRDLSKVIYIDHDPKSFQLSPENVLRVPKWEGNMDDTALLDLAELLKTIHLSDVDDVRPTLQYYSQFDNPAKEFRRRAIELAEKEKIVKESSTEENILKRYGSKLFKRFNP